MAAQIALFDLGGVLLDWSPTRLYSQVFSNAAEADRFLAEVCTMEWHTEHDRGVSFADNAAPLIARYPQYEAQISAWHSRWGDMFGGYVSGTDRLVEMLYGKGVPLYALSNMPAEIWQQMLDMFPALKRFREVVVSGQIGLVKPDPAIFNYTRTRMGDPDPGDVLFIDDLPRNIAMAEAMGYQTHLFTDAARLESELIRQGLL
ncbi:HAD family phosphatase [Hyphomonas sp. WL0036]|uniref:HAD family hydrolase n=1 Tax=Hyphomonas sediminis TaxID=2866160 RepID=UPI001C817FDA|nr:HAD family phosphatase [Hyphomonas sediminis]MBY9066118.1 HAD family phosphatase [Hyphomonas sediminis]